MTAHDLTLAQIRGPERSRLAWPRSSLKAASVRGVNDGNSEQTRKLSRSHFQKIQKPFAHRVVCRCGILGAPPAGAAYNHTCFAFQSCCSSGTDELVAERNAHVAVRSGQYSVVVASHVVASFPE